jgi:hypothetical protein
MTDIWLYLGGLVTLLGALLGAYLNTRSAARCGEVEVIVMQTATEARLSLLIADTTVSLWEVVQAAEQVAVEEVTPPQQAWPAGTTYAHLAAGEVVITSDQRRRLVPTPQVDPLTVHLSAGMLTPAEIRRMMLAIEADRAESVTEEQAFQQRITDLQQHLLRCGIWLTDPEKRRA